MIVWLLFSLLWLAWLIFILLWPIQWASIVDKENGYWVKKGLLKVTTAEKVSRFEKGIGFKILIVIGLALFLFNSWVASLPK